MYSTPAAYATPTPHQAFSPPAPPRTAQPRGGLTNTPNVAPPSVRTSAINSALQVQDPVLETRKALALLVGLGPGAQRLGLVDQLELDVTRVLDSYDRVYEHDDRDRVGEPDSPGLELGKMYDTLDTLVSILSRSAPGGYSPQQASSSVPPGIAPTDLEFATRTVQTHFKELQRCKDGAEIVRAGLVG
ncbi:hypothetical protein JCM11491_003107 [Sporobolomyces phaffii]